PLSRRSTTISARASILLQNLTAMTIDLTAREVSDILDGLDNTIECMADWREDEFNTARDRRGRRRRPSSLGPRSKSRSSMRQTITWRFQLREPVAALER